MPRHRLLAAISWLLLVPAASAQSGGIELFAGETLFAEGTRVSLTSLVEKKRTLRAGSSSVADPLDLEFTERREVFGVDHGLNRDLTLSVLVPRVSRRRGRALHRPFSRR